MMEALYVGNKLEATGFINFWDEKSFVKHKGIKPSQFLRNRCSFIYLYPEDRIMNVQVQSANEGVTALMF